MRLTRIHVPPPLATGSDVTLPAQAAEHLTRVLRMSAGAAVTLFDGSGGEYSATLNTYSGRRVTARVLAHRAVEREAPLDITLLQGIARGERMDLIVQKATELGVTRILPVLAERSVVRLDAKQRDRKHEHWQGIAISACEQCGRNRIPEISAPLSLDAALRACPDAALRCMLAADAGESLTALAGRAGNGPVALLIGPEGGLADGEEAFARANRFTACRLGPRIMRTETAGLAALAALQTVSGDFR